MRLLENSNTRNLFDAIIKESNKSNLLKSRKLLKESSNIIWTSEITEDDYDKEELRNNQYQDYLNNTDDPKDFDEWFEEYIIDDSDDQWYYKEEDLKDNVLPMIDKQVNGAIFITGNYNSRYPEFRKSGPGGKIVADGESLIDWLSEEDAVKFTNEEGNQIGVSAYDHDGSIGGMLFTLPQDQNEILEIAMSTGYYDKEDYDDESGIIDDFLYDLSHNNVNMHDVKKIDTLVPITNGFLVTESLKEEGEVVKEKEPNCVIFYLNNKELGGHDLANEFEGEREAAKELFAYENNVKPEEIEERLEYRESLNESFDHEAPEELELLIKEEIEKNNNKFPDEIEYKGKIYKAFNVMSNTLKDGRSLVYYCNMENTPNGDPQESNDYFFINARLKELPDKNGYEGVEEVNYVEDLTEADKQKKKENRIIMQQNNVTCLKDGNIYKVFENEKDNLKEYDNQEDAMKDALARCGVNPDNELKDEINESEELNNKKEDYFADFYYKYQEDNNHEWTKDEIQDWIEDDIKSGNSLYKLEKDDIDLLYNFQHNLYNADKEDLYESKEEDLKGNDLFDKYQLIEDYYIDTDLWNESTKEEREEMIKPAVEDFVNKYKKDLKNDNIFKSFTYVMTDNNAHTALRLIKEFLNK